ncbi:hypothetical protein MTR67_044836, partial [Solanum verrucosum]
VSLSAFAFLFSELVQYNQTQVDNITELERSNNTYAGSLNVQGSVNDETVLAFIIVNNPDSVSKILREVPGNDKCSDCGASEPDWASLNLGILICIECSSIHRNLCVHISKVRSITLDVRVWEPTILDLFRTLGNFYCNSMWEKLLQLPSDGFNVKGPLPAKKRQNVERYQRSQNSNLTVPRIMSTFLFILQLN